MLNGSIPKDIEVDNPFARDILQHIAKRKQLPDIDLYITPEEIAKGFR
jgi:hypothetical protein